MFFFPRFLRKSCLQSGFLTNKHKHISHTSWTKGWRQIYEITQNRFFCGMFYSWFFPIFYQKTSKFGFWVDGWVLVIKYKYFRDFLSLFFFLCRQLMRKLVHSLSGDNNLVPFHLWWRKIVLKSEKVYKYFVQDCLETFSEIFTSLKMASN